MTYEQWIEEFALIEKIDLLKITDRSVFLIKQPGYHPSTKAYKEYKIKQYESIIYGFWGKQKDKYRWMPPMTYFYCNYVKIELENENKETLLKKANLDDVEWIIGYALAACYGFSGFENDDDYSCDKALINRFEFEAAERSEKRLKTLYNKKGELKKYITVEEYLYKEFDNEMGKPLWFNEAEDLMIFGSRGSGKMLQLQEKVRTFKGWTEMQNLKVGDLVYGSNGKLAPVISVSEEQTGEYYKITLRDGRTIEACEDHLWKVWDKTKNKNRSEVNYSVLSTKEMVSNYYFDRKGKNNERTKEFRYALPVNESINEHSELPLDPYFLGLLLGDGCLTKGTAPSITTNDQEILDYCIKQCELNNWTYRITINKNKNIFITNKNKVKSLPEYLKELGLYGTKSNSKFIPDIYLYASEEDKLQLTRGLLDTDGTIDKSHVEYYTVSDRLKNDFMNLIRSLGISCNSRVKKTHYIKNGIKINCQDCHRISIFTDKHIFNLKRKQDKLKKESNRSYSRINKTFIIDIQPIGKRIGKCISVDNYDNTYITKDYIVTHNTFSIVGLICWLLIMDGTKSISKDWIDFNISASIIAGAASDTSLSEINRRVETALNCLLTDDDLGVYKAPGLEPVPLLGRHFLGQIHNGITYNYIVNGVKSGGTGSSYEPISYSPNKKGATTSAASKRVALSVVDECGRMPVSIKSIHGSNSALCKRITKFGVQLFAGTSSSDLELVQEAKEMFLNPTSYNMHGFKNKYTKDNVLTTGLYLPAILVQRNYKDANGNTQVNEVLKYFAYRRSLCETADSLREEQLNYPIFVEEMWNSRQGSIFPKEQIKKRLNQLTLMKNRKEDHKFRKFCNLTWDLGKVEIEWVESERAVKIDTFKESQGENSKKKDTDTNIIIYELPEPNSPPDMYLFSCDTYVADEKTEGSSLGSVFILKNPKYMAQGYTGNIIVAEYTGKPDSRNIFYDNVLKLMTLYNAGDRTLMFEANRGADKLTEYFKKMNKEYLLAFTPDKYKNTFKEAKSNKYGYVVGVFEAKTELLTYFAEWLLEPNGDYFNVELINSIGLLSELLAYDAKADKDKKHNYDRIMSFLGCLIAKREVVNEFIREDRKDSIHKFFIKK